MFVGVDETWQTAIMLPIRKQVDETLDPWIGHGFLETMGSVQTEAEKQQRFDPCSAAETAKVRSLCCRPSAPLNFIKRCTRGHVSGASASNLPSEPMRPMIFWQPCPIKGVCIPTRIPQASDAATAVAC